MAVPKFILPNLGSFLNKSSVITFKNTLHILICSMAKKGCPGRDMAGHER
jgi:hypothetical protein